MDNERRFAHIWCNTSYCRYVATVQGQNATLSLGYVDHYSPHPRHILLFRLCKPRKICGLHRKPSSDEIQGIGECHRCYPRKPSAQEVFPRRCRDSWLDSYKLLRISISMVLTTRELAATALTALACATYLLVEIVARELHSRVRYYAYTVGTISSHETFPAFIPPHLHESLPNRQLVFRPSRTLYLEQNLESL